MAGLLAAVFLYVGVLVLLVSGVSHMVRIDSFRAAIASHRIWPQGTEVLVAQAVTAAEIGIGGTGIVMAVSGHTENLGAVLLAASGLYATFAAYGMLLLTRRPGASCGCAAVEQHITPSVPVRAALLGVSAAIGSESMGYIASLGSAPIMETAIAWLAALTFMGLALSLPEALHDPSSVAPAHDEERP